LGSRVWDTRNGQFAFLALGFMIQVTMKKATSRSGFTFVEVMVATLVAGIALAGVLASALFATRLNYSSSQRFAAFALCKEPLEDIRETRFNEVLTTMTPVSGVRYSRVENNVPLTQQGPNGGVLITGTRRVDVWDYRAHASYLEHPHYYVRVRFTWRSRTGGDLSTNPQKMVEIWSRIYPR